MRVRMDFVSNSSSANFMLYVTSTCTDVEEFEDLFRKYLKTLSCYSRYEYNKDENHFEEKIPLQLESEDFEDEDEIRTQINETVTKIQIIPRYKLDQISSNVFKVETMIIMFNDMGDTPRYMADIVLNLNVNPNSLIEYGIVDAKLRIDDWS